MTNSEQAIREYVNTLIERVWETGNSDSHECNTRFDDLRNLQNCVSNNLDDAVEKLTALISEHYVSKDEHEKMKHNLTHCGSCGKPLSRDCPECKHLWES